MILKWLIPPQRWRLPVAILLGMFFGLAAYTVKVSNAVSYLSDEPETCINCHVMIPEYASWQHSSHREKTVCNDCHVPHNNVITKYLFKAHDGMRHATAFTLRTEPEVIRIKEAGKSVVQQNCIRCHLFVNENVSSVHSTLESAKAGESKLCWDCHREVPHGRVHSLSATPNAHVPMKSDIVPQWLQNQVDKNHK